MNLSILRTLLVGLPLAALVTACAAPSGDEDAPQLVGTDLEEQVSPTNNGWTTTARKPMSGAGSSEVGYGASFRNGTSFQSTRLGGYCLLIPAYGSCTQDEQCGDGAYCIRPDGTNVAKSCYVKAFFGAYCVPGMAITVGAGQAVGFSDSFTYQQSGEFATISVLSKDGATRCDTPAKQQDPSICVRSVSALSVVSGCANTGTCP